MAAGLVPRMEASGDVWDLAEVRARPGSDLRPARPSSAGGRAARLARVKLARELGTRISSSIDLGLGRPRSCGARAGEAATEFLTEVEATPALRDSPTHVVLPAMVRTALGDR